MGRFSCTANFPTTKQIQHTEFSGVETMSHTQSMGHASAEGSQRVRDQAREVLALMAFSAAMATGISLLLMLLLHLGQRG